MIRHFMMTRLILLAFSIALGANLSAQHTNIIVDKNNDADEPSICIDPQNPSRVVAGGNVANIFYSADTGKMWKRKLQTSTLGVYGDPVIVCDTAGAFYHFHLSNPPDGSWIDRIVCQKSVDGGKTWNNGSFMGKNGSKNQDKHWISIDRRTNALYCTWTQFDKYESREAKDSSHIMFSKSVDGGATWADAKRINAFGGDCLDDDNTVEGAVPAVGTEGSVNVAWAGAKGLMFNRSVDGGATWWAEEKKIADIGGGWSYNISGIYRCNGLPFTLCDTAANSPFRGSIYVNFTDQRNGVENTDVWLVKSTDNGKTWSQPTRVNRDNSMRQQFFSSMTVDPKTGHLWFVYYDRSRYKSDSTDVFMALSRDGGETFTNFKVSEKPFVPDKSSFFGDYTHISAVGDVVRPIWTAMNNRGQKTIYTALVDVAAIGDFTEGGILSPKIEDFKVQSPVDTEGGKILINLKEKTCLTLNITDEAGNVVTTVFKNKDFKKGTHQAVIDSNQLEKGKYQLVLKNKKGKALAGGRIVRI
jgi:hypothetical protein